MPASLSAASVRLRALRAPSPCAALAAGRRFTVMSELIWPACGIVENGPRMPSGCVTHGPSYALMRFK